MLGGVSSCRIPRQKHDSQADVTRQLTTDLPPQFMRFGICFPIADSFNNTPCFSLRSSYLFENQAVVIFLLRLSSELWIDGGELLSAGYS